MLKITKDTFKEAPTDTKLNFLFDYISDIHTQQVEHPEGCKKRFAKLEGRKLKDTGIASALGFVGGFVAVWGKKLLGG